MKTKYISIIIILIGIFFLSFYLYKTTRLNGGTVISQEELLKTYSTDPR